MRVLVVNAGSSSLKISVLGADDTLLVEHELPAPEPGSLRAVLDDTLGAIPDVDVAGHRVVHGGAAFRDAIVLDGDVDDRLDHLAELAPLHNPPAVAAIRALQALRPELPQVACFDTAFHATIPAAATTYAVPEQWRSWGLRRFGFHGLSHAYATRRASHVLDRPLEDLRLVSAHIGAGASLAAVAGGRSVDTTMGYTPLEGLVMATRSGSVDPGILVWVLRHRAMTVDEIEDALTRRSGLLALAGSEDLRAVWAAADAGDGEAAVAAAVYVHRLRGAVAAMAAAMGGVDGVVFTGGAGWGSARLRRDTCAALGFLGIELDDERNESPRDPGASDDAGDRVVSRAGAGTAVVVVHAREDLEISRQVRAVMSLEG